MADAPSALLAHVDDVGRLADQQASEAERLRRLPDDVAAGIVRTGLPRAMVPARYGGGEHDVQHVLDAIERLATHDGSTAWCAMITATTGLCAAYLDPDRAQEVYGDPGVMAGGFAMPVGRAVPVEGGLLVTGRWQWGSATHHCTWIGGGCWVTGADGRPSPRHDGLAAPFVLFPRDEVRIHDTWRVAGLKATGSNDFEVDGVLVPEGRWADFARGRPVVDGPLYRFPFLGALALGICAVSLGLAQRAQAELVEVAGGKRPAGSSRSLAERPVVQAAVARAEAAWRSARALVREAVGEAWERAAAGRPLDDDLRRRLRLSATNATWQSAAAVDLMYHAGGGSSIHESSPLQRVFRDAHVATQHAMVAERTYEPVGRMVLGLPTDAGQL